MHLQPEMESFFFILPGLNPFVQVLWPRAAPQPFTKGFKRLLEETASCFGKQWQMPPAGKARGSPVLGLEREKGSKGCQHWEINPLAGPVASISCLQQNGRRTQSFCQLTESNHVFNFY